MTNDERVTTFIENRRQRLSPETTTPSAIYQVIYEAISDYVESVEDWEAQDSDVDVLPWLEKYIGIEGEY